MTLAEKLAEFVLRCGQTAYTEGEESLTFHGEISRRVLEQALTSIPADRRLSVLDVGCANGFMRELFYGAGYRYYRGVTSRLDDIHTDDPWRKCEGYRDMFVTFTGCDMHNIALWPKAGKGYDLIWARHILEHSPIPLFLIESLRDQMADDGYLYVEVPSPQTVCLHALNENHYSCFSREGWFSLFLKAGMKIVQSWDFHVDIVIGPDEYFCFLLQSASRQKAATTDDLVAEESAA